ncbi:response regulator transcription factor [Nocardia goodfellowii]|uniref:DNA-binding NarL/FixJ family response regulator n=1 Tax=Nocardia goodfellowii TaxID=882446 RepID=A0ABS4QRM7_9NOCA|nr:response regulator transcription factor [Nocardia goodfellowii]MBP2193286.1 DNA-binding NarL/FixJ family response regulator [Nocardia goodfellowii]
MRVVIAEDSTLLREGLTRLLADEGHEVTAVGTAIELVHEIDRDTPDLAIVDVRMPPTHSTEGLDAAKTLKARYPDLGVLVLSQYVEQRSAVELLTAGQGGVGYLLKDRIADLDTFLADMNRVANGGTAFDPEVVRQLFAQQRRPQPLAALSPRELDVLHLLSQGYTNTGTADHLSLSVSAVEKHVNAIFTKLELAKDPNHSQRVRAVLIYLEQNTS